jgi:LacI family transcriptional regulator
MQEQATGRVRLQDIAEACGVSKMTVSLALRRHPSIKAATAERVRARAEAMGYVAAERAPRRPARTSPARQRTVGMILPQTFTESAYYLALYMGVLQGAADAGYALITTYYDSMAVPISPRVPSVLVPRQWKRIGVDGIIIANVNQDLAAFVAELSAQVPLQHCPVVSIPGHDPTIASVGPDDFRASYTLARHLLELGHRRVLRLHHPGLTASFQPRIDGMRLAFAESGFSAQEGLTLLPIPDDWLANRQAEDDPTPAALVAAVRAQGITAVVASNDYAARFAYRALTAAGFRVPDDVSMVGFDDLGLDDDWMRQHLTTVHLPLHEIGRQAVHLVGTQILHTDATNVSMTIPAPLVVRSSTAPPRA